MRHAQRRLRVGSIPACAGEPLVPVVYPLAWRVYPRVCGGTPTPAMTDPTHGGLSPRVRGNLDDGALDVLPGRSIPACAGEPAGRISG